MNITYRIDKSILYIAIEGRIDASNAGDVEEQIFAIKRQNEGAHTVIDADDLEYISSAGLRVILKLRREEPKLAVINVSTAVYDIFDMTGFTDMVTVEKAYRKMSVEGCEFMAKGANGAVYRYDDETILKVYFSKDALPEIQQERESARRAFILGINTAIPYGIVRVGEGYGTVTELLNAVNVTKLMCEDPINLEKPVEYSAQLLKNIHSTEAGEGDFPDFKEKALGWVDYIEGHIPEAQHKKLRAMIEAIPRQNTMLHGDFHTNNVMIQNGEPILIDLDKLGVGHPVFEFAFMYNAMLGFSEVDRDEIKSFMGYDRDTSERFWNMLIRRYLGTDDPVVCRELEYKARVIGYTKLVRRIIYRSDKDWMGEKLTHYKNQLIEFIDKVDTLEF